MVSFRHDTQTNYFPEVGISLLFYAAPLAILFFQHMEDILRFVVYLIDQDQPLSLTGTQVRRHQGVRLKEEGNHSHRESQGTSFMMSSVGSWESGSMVAIVAFYNSSFVVSFLIRIIRSIRPSEISKRFCFRNRDPFRGVEAPSSPT